MDIKSESNRVYIEDDNGNITAELTFPITPDGNVDINRTFVDTSLRGMGIAGKLMTAAAERIRASGQKTRASCSYAQKWFEKNPDYSDIYIAD